MAEETFVIKARDETKAAFASIDRGLNKLGLSFGALGPAVGITAVAGLAAFVKSSIDVADKADETAKALGLTTEAYSKLGYVTKMTGADQGALDNALFEMNKRLAEAAIGSGEAAKAYAVLGLNAKQLASESPDQAFEQIVAALEKIPNANDKALISSKLFGKQAKSLAGTLSLGSDGFREMGAEAELLGAIIDDETAVAAGEFNDNLDRLGTLSRGVGMKMATHLLPALHGITDAMVDAAKESKALDVFGSALGFTLKGLASAAIAVADGFELVTTWTIAAGTAAAAAAKGNFAEARDIMQKNGEEILAISNKTAKALDKIWAEQVPEDRKQKRGQPQTDLSLEGLGSDKGEDPAEKLRQDAAKKYDAMDESLMTENERLSADHEAKLMALDNYYVLSDMTEQGYREKREALEQQHQDKLKQITDKSKSEQQKLWESGLKGRLEVTSDVLGALSVLMQSENKKQFEIGKKAAIAQAIVDTYLGAQRAYTALAGIAVVGPALGTAAAIAAIAAGMFRVNAIRSQQFGGTGSAAPGGGATPTFDANPNTGQPTAPIGLPDPSSRSPARNINLTIESDSGVVSTSWVRDTLIPSINEALGDGVSLNVSPA